MTVGRILVRGKDEGSGFALATRTSRSSRVVLTAHHVLHGQDAPSVQFLLPTGHAIQVQSVDLDDDIDVAVLHLEDGVPEALAAARPQEGTAWQVAARPRANDPKLTGVVSDTQRRFNKTHGSEVRVVQLLVDQTVGEYEGYSGSPVMLRAAETAEGGVSSSPPVLGVLIEQLRWRVPPRPGQPRPPASNVLYAIPIQDVLARFELDAVWAPVDDGPSDAELVPRYLAALTTRFAHRYEPTPHIALGLRRGTRAPAVVPAALRRDQDKLHATLRPHLSPAPPERAADAGRPVVDLLAFQVANVRVVLLGRPGAGKSTTLRHLVADLGAPWSSATADDTTRVPVFADLSEWHDASLDLPSFLQDRLWSLGQPALADRLPDLMRRGRAVLLLDGLNELPGLRRDPVTGHLDDPRVDAVAALGRHDEWRAVGCVLSCRATDFAGGPAWHDLYLLDLDGGKVSAFAEAYFHDTPDAAAAARGFVHALGASPRAARLRGLVANPFFLAKALAYYSVVGRIPDGLAELLTFTVAEALERERLGDREDEVRRRLGWLAFRMTVEGRFGAVDPERAATWLAPDGGSDDDPDSDLADSEAARWVWRAAEGASLLVVSDDEVRFTHQLVQEFFAAGLLRDRPLTAAVLTAAGSATFAEVWPLWADLDPALVDRLVPFLDDPGPATRRAAATLLGALGDRRAGDPLARVLDDADDAVRRQAALGLAALRDPRATAPLVADLRSVDDGVRRVAAHALGTVGDPGAVDPLVEVLAGDPTGAVRAAAATALGAMADGRVLHPLVRALVESGDEEVSHAAAHALGRLGDPRAVPDLLAALDDQTTEPAATEGLRAIGEQALDPLIDLLHYGRTPKRRERAAFVLGLMHRPRAVPPLVAALGDPAKDVRERSADALGAFGEPALGPLLDVLDDGVEEAQRWALRALGLMADPRAVPHLITVLRGESEQLAPLAARALRTYKGAAVAPLVEILHEDLDPQTCWYAGVTLGGLGEPGVAPLVGGARSDDFHVRVAAVAGLAQAADNPFRFDPVDPRVVEALAIALYDTEPAVRRLSALALAQVGDVRAVPGLDALVSADDPELQTTALAQLGRIEDAAAVRVLVTALRDADPAVRKAAGAALRRMLFHSRALEKIIGTVLADADDADAGTAPLIALLDTWRGPHAAPPYLEALRQAMPPLVAALRDPEGDVVSVAAGALERATRAPVDLSPFLPADGKDDPDAARLRLLVRESLVPLADPRSVSVLLSMLDELDDESDDAVQPARSTIAALLGALGAVQAVPALIDLLGSANSSVCEEAAEALARLGDPRALPALVAALSTEAPRSTNFAFALEQGVLAVADGRTAGLLLATLRGSSWHARGDVVNLLRSLGELALVDLVAALDDPEVADAAAEALDPEYHEWSFLLHRDRPWRLAPDALDRLGDTEVDRLRAAAGSADLSAARVARVARALLERLGHPVADDAPVPEPPPTAPPEPERSLDALHDDLASNDVETRTEAARALGLRRDRRAVRPLLARLTDEAPAVRAAAAIALGLLGDRSTVEPVGTLLADSDVHVADSAIFGLQEIGGAAALQLLLDALENASDPVRARTAFSLGDFTAQDFQEVGVAQVVGSVLAAVRRARGHLHPGPADSSVYFGAAKALPKLGAEGRTLLLAALDDSHDAVRHLAVHVLSAAADVRAYPLLEWMAAHDSGEYVDGGKGKPRHAAESGLRAIRRAHQVRAPLIEATASGDRLTRYGAAFLLSSLEWRDATPVLVEALHDTDLRLRWGAAGGLGTLGDERAIAPLVAALGDPVDDVRLRAADALVRCGPAVITPVVATLDADDAQARARAAQVLGDVGGPGEIDRLTAALTDPVRNVSSAAANAVDRLVERGVIADLDTGAVVDALAAAFGAATPGDQWDDEWARRSIVGVLAKIDPARAVDLLVEALGNPNEKARLDAARELGKLGDRRAVAPLNRALSDEFHYVRKYAAYSLRELADASSVEPLLARVDDEATSAARAALEALSAIGDPRAAAPLVASLRAGRGDTRSEVADVLVALADETALVRLAAQLDEELPEREGYGYGSPEEPPELDVLVRVGARAVPALVGLLADPATSRRAYGWSALALERIGASAVAVLLDGMVDPDDDRALAHARGLAEAGEPGVAALRAALADERAGVRAAAAGGLWFAQDVDAVKPLLAALHDVDASVRESAAQALGNCGVAEAIGPLTAALGDPARSVRLCAAIGLAQLGDERGIERLVAALAEDDVKLACYAAGWIGGLGLAAGAEPLIAALQDGPAELRGACAVALGDIGDGRALGPLDRAAGDPSPLSAGGTVGTAAAAAARQIRGDG